METFSVYVVQEDCLPSVSQRMWFLLRSSLLHYIRSQASASADACNSAAADLLLFAKLAEKVCIFCLKTIEPPIETRICVFFGTVAFLVQQSTLNGQGAQVSARLPSFTNILALIFWFF